MKYGRAGAREQAACAPDRGRHGWRLADADPQQAVDALKPSALSDDGQPSFAKTGDWGDLLDPGERMDMLRRSQQNRDMQQRQQQKADADAGNAIASRYVDQLAADPTGVDVGALARERFPESQQDTRQALLGAAQTAIAQAGDTAAKGYGPSFWPTFNRVTAADGDPDKITDPVELYKLAGPDGGGALTMAGVRELLRVLDQNKTVEGRAQSAMEQNLLRAAHAQIRGTDDASGSAGDQKFQNFLGAYFPALDAGLKSGKTAAELLTPNSPDYPPCGAKCDCCRARLTGAVQTFSPRAGMRGPQPRGRCPRIVLAAESP